MDRERAAFEMLGYRLEGEPFVDPIQGVAGAFMVGEGPRIELLENLPGSSTLSPWLDAGIKMYHLAYVVDDVDGAVSWARSRRAHVVAGPSPATGFGGRRICFVMFRTGQLLEFIERGQ